MNLAIWLVSVQALLKAVAMMESASIVVKKGELAVFTLESMLIRSVVTQRRTAPILVSSKEPAVFVTKKVTLLRSALTSLPLNASTASRKVSCHSAQYAPPLVSDTASRASNLGVYRESCF